jgi:hypothetical protein
MLSSSFRLHGTDLHFICVLGTVINDLYQSGPSPSSSWNRRKCHSGIIFPPLSCSPYIRWSRTVKDADDLPGIIVLFFRFARKVLSITANFTSCERLFSAYGMILDT